MTTRGDPLHGLAEALRAVRAAVAETAYPLPLPSAEPARAGAEALLRQIDDHLLPRLERLDAPLLAVVSGGTGAGKSTLVNSLVRAPVSPAGVLRPTTRAPVLACHPADLPWFSGARRLGRAAGPNLRAISAPALSPGLAYLDAPDVDSAVEQHRALADQVLQVADLWLFVTTAARYADAVPWELLHLARERGTAVALVLDRVPGAAAREITADLSGMLTAYGPAGVPLFVVPETRVDGQGLLPEPVTEPLRSWFDRLAMDGRVHAGVVGSTLEGALHALPAAVEGLASAADEQLSATEALAEQVGLAYGAARATVERGVRAGTLLRGEVLARWRPAAAGTGRIRAVRDLVRRWWDRAVAPVPGRAGAAHDLPDALEHGLVTLLRGAAVDAGEQTGTAWRLHPAGAELPAADLPAPSSGLDEQVTALVRQWRRGVWDLAGGRAPAGVRVMVGVLASPPAGGVPPPSFEDPPTRALVDTARADLLDRIGQLLDAEAARWLGRLAGVPLDRDPAQRMRAALAELDAVRAAAAADGPAEAGPAEPTEAEPAAFAEAARADPAQPGAPGPRGEPPQAAPRPRRPQERPPAGAHAGRPGEVE